MRSLASVVFVALVVTACSSGTESTPATPSTAPTTTSTVTSTTAPTTTRPVETTIPPGWTAMTGNGYTIGLPPRWIDGSAMLDEDLLAAVADQFDGSDLETMKGMAEEFIANDAVDMAFDLDHVTDTFAENMNVISFPAGSADDMALALDLGPVQLEAAGAKNVTSERVSLDRFDAAFLTYDLVDMGVAVGHQYWVVTDETVYVITFSGGERADPDQWRAMVETFVPIR